MKSFVYIALAVFLGTVAVQGYGHGSPHGPPHGPPHHGFDPHQPPPNHMSHSDESPSWDSKSDSSGSKSDSSGSKSDSSGSKSDSSDSCYDSCDSFSCDKHHSGSFDSSFEDSGDWHHKKDPCAKKTTLTPAVPTKPTAQTTPADGGLTTISPKIAKCIKSCPSTPEYNPVCGSDGKTYDNEGKLRCAKSCGVNVTLQRRSPCPQPTTLTPIPETTTTLPETTTTDGGLTTISPKIAKCIKSCPSTPEYNPVCGSDGKTYDNEGKLRCAKSCGVNVTLQSRSPCPQPTTPTPIPETTTTLPETTTDGGKIAKCIKSCPSTSEYNPVCGSDGKTYDNEWKLFCAKYCGVDVTIQHRSECPKPTTPKPIPETTTTLPEPTTTDGDKIAKCIKSCPSTPEYNPVCGSDGKTYDNEGKLFCAKSCGVDVTLRRRSVCPPPIPDDGGSTRGTPPPTTTATTPLMGHTTPSPDFTKCMSQCAITPSFNHVCGTDLVTYMNMDRLKCAQKCGKVIEVLCEKPCAACGSKPVTTTLPPITTTQGGRTTPEYDVQDCIRNCPVTSEYNPVCGTNQVTYSNPGRLLCAQMCGVDVAVSRSGPCGLKITTSTTTSKPTTTTQGGRTTPEYDVQDCIKNCPVTSEYNPVCGTNQVTYSNPGRLLCAQMCGVDVAVSRSGPCGLKITTSTTTSKPTTTTQGGRTTPQYDVQDCIRNCPVTSEYNPVCGTNQVTYNNPGRLLCAQMCGVDVAVSRSGPCGLTTTSSTTTSKPITTTQGGRTTPEHDVQKCIRNCPVTSEYNPVCGTDQVSYVNPGRLLCAQMCGVDVAISHSGPCGLTPTTTEAPSTTLSPKISSCIKRCPATSENEPVCGTDNLTYNNIGDLYCAKFCGVDVDVKYKSRCVDENKDRLTTPMPPTTPSLKETTDPGPNTSTTSGFTLDPDVIDKIFGKITTQPPTTKKYNPDDDEDLDLDVRYNEAKHEEESS